MRILSSLVVASLFCVSLIAQNPNQLYNWVHEQTQTSAFYRSGETLYTFLEETAIMTDPCLESEAVIVLPIGYPLENDFYSFDENIPEDAINGYGDVWFRVRGEGLNGEYFEGYVWGGDLAKGWRVVDLSNDGVDEFVMLGLPAEMLRAKGQEKAEIRVVRHYDLVSQSLIDGVCIAENCNNMPLLRMIPNQPISGSMMIEVSTMPIHCAKGVGLYRTYSVWQPTTQRVEYVYGGSYMANVEDKNIRFTQGTTVCQFSHEDQNFNPVWDCKSLTGKPNNKESKKVDRV